MSPFLSNMSCPWFSIHSRRECCVALRHANDILAEGKAFITSTSEAPAALTCQSAERFGKDN